MRNYFPVKSEYGPFFVRAAFLAATSLDRLAVATALQQKMEEVTGGLDCL